MSRSAPMAQAPVATPISSAEARAIRAVREDLLLEWLAELVAFDSTANRETPAQRHMADLLAGVGMDVDLWDIDFDALQRHAAYGTDVPRSAGLGVVGRRAGSRSGPSLILQGHIDVVDAGELDRWSHPPFRMTREGDRIYGRGTCDMKGGLACALMAAHALREAGVHLAGDLQIQSVIGEEDGGSGALATLLRGHVADGAIVLEPTQQLVAPAQAGALSFRITVPGAAAHGAEREEGVDPVEKFYGILTELRALEAHRNRNVTEPLFANHALPYALSMGRVEAGNWPSSVAECLVAEGRYGVAPGEDLDDARGQLEDAVRRAAADDPWLRHNPPTVSWWGASFEGARTQDDATVVTALRSAAHAVAGSEPALAGMRYGSDMRLLTNVSGIPTVLFGAGDIRVAHRPNEWNSVEALLEATRTIVVAAMRFCGVAEPT